MRPTRPHTFEDHLTDELWIALEDFAELSHITAWCAKECATAGLGICARICQDIAEIAELNETLISRDSMFGPEAAELFVRIARHAVTELRRYEGQHPHLTETIAAIDRTIHSCSTILEMVGQGGRERSGQMDGTNRQGPGGRTAGQRTGGETARRGTGDQF